MQSWLLAVDYVGRHTGSWRYIKGSTRNHENEGKTNKLGWMLYFGVCCTRCQLMIMTWRDRERDDLTLCSAMMVELWTRKREMGDEDENDVGDYERI